MSSHEQIPPPELDDSSDDETYMDIPEWHKHLLLERMARYQSEGFIGTPWEEFEQEFMND